MDFSEIVKNKLVGYKKDEIIITEHATIQALFRCISLEEIKENIIYPKRLSIAIKQEALNINEEKYDCYFGYNDFLCHRYIIIINKSCIVCTVIKINRRWMEIAKKNAEI